MIVIKYLGIQELEPKARSLLIKFFYFFLINSFFMSLSSTFFALYLIDFLGFAVTGIVVAVMLLTQFIFDYPSGSLGDYIGQRWVLILGYLSWGIGFFFLVTAQKLSTFLIVAIVNGFGSAFFSGALDSWLDNNYKKIDTVDADRKIYGFARSRVNTINNIAFAASFMTGGLLSTVYSRQVVFSLQVFLSLTMVFVVLTQIKDVSIKTDIENAQRTREKGKKSHYFAYLKGGLRFMISNKTVFFCLLGMAILTTTWTIWAMLVLFPIYFGYTGDDFGANLLRTIIYLNGFLIGLYVARVSKKFSTEHYPKILLVFILLFFPAILSLLIFIPVQNTFNLVGFLLIILTMNCCTGFIYRIGEVLRMRLLVDLVPSANRNAVYSLIPTITSLLGMLLLPIAGQVIERFELVGGVIVVLFVYFIGLFSITIGFKFMNQNESDLPIDGSKPTKRADKVEVVY
ncbi:MAG: MFS transporter [Candidatus Hodarchaeota archaeon]